jgi:hypothetical protein
MAGNVAHFFSDCYRKTANINDRDRYEPCEPKLNEYCLPWFYFISSAEKLRGVDKDEYMYESAKLWEKSHSSSW